MHEHARLARLRRLLMMVIVSVAAVGGLSLGRSWANEPPPPPAQPSPPAEGSPAQPPPAAETPAPPTPAQAPTGEPFIPPGAQVETPPAAPVETPPAAPAQPASPSPPAAPSLPTPSESDSSPTASDGSSTSGTERAVGGGVALAGVAAAAAGGLFGRRDDETKDEHTRRIAGAGIWTAGGVTILVVKGVTLATGLAGAACLVVAWAIWRWGAPGRVRAQPAPQGPPVDLQEHLNAAQDHNLELNRGGVKTQSQTAPNAVDDQ